LIGLDIAIGVGGHFPCRAAGWLKIKGQEYSWCKTSTAGLRTPRGFFEGQKKGGSLCGVPSSTPNTARPIALRQQTRFSPVKISTTLLSDLD